MSQSNFAPLGINNQEKLLTPAEVAALFRVDPKTVTRWAKAGKLTSIRTLGGHRRYKESEVKALLKLITPNSTENTKRLGGN
jgi:excisionase family DNA binding protein